MSSCATICRRVAPSERRTAISIARPAPRASSRFAMFAHAMSSTIAVMHMSRSERRLRRLVQRALSAPPVLERDELRLERFIVESLIPFWSGASTVLRIGEYTALIAAFACAIETPGLRRPNEIDPVARAIRSKPVVEAGLHLVAHRDRHEHLGRRAERRALESARRDADDGHRLAVDDDRLARWTVDRRRTATPEAVAQHGDEVLADRRVVLAGRTAVRARGVSPSTGK